MVAPIRLGVRTPLRRESMQPVRTDDVVHPTGRASGVRCRTRCCAPGAAYHLLECTKGVYVVTTPCYFESWVDLGHA
jgi:hypothetical protein